MSSTTGLVPEIRAGGVKNHEETVSLIHILDDLNDMRSQVAEVQGQLSLVSSEKEHLEKENKILKEENVQLKKDNFLMKSRLEKMMSSEKVKESSDVEEVDAGGDNRLEKLKEDMAEQERLISGFQKENERIYGELKKAKQTSKEVEQAMYEENLKLKSEIAKLKEEVELHTAINKAHHGGLENVRISDFNSDDVSHDVKELKTKIHLLENQVKAEEGLRLKADSLVRKITEERDRAEKQLTVNSCKTEESRSKLIAEHKAELENVKSELADARRMLASKSDAALTIRDIMNSPPSKSLLTHFQRRVKKLESDLENRDTRASKAVASVQDQYSSIKSRYEERINDLEKQIKAFRENMNKKGDSQIETVQDKQALEKKLSETLFKLKEESEHRRMERDALFEQINMLRQQNAAAKERRPPVNDSNLRREVEDKNKEIERLNALVEKLGNTVPRGRRAPVKSGNKKSSYNPNSFEGEGYSGLMEQNAVLKKELQDKELEHKHSQVTKDAHIAKLEQEIKALKLVHDKDLENMREKESVQHLPDVKNQLLNDKLAALEQKLKLRCQEIFELKSDLKEAAVAKVREQALQQQIQQLVGQVHEARLCSPSSSARKVASLEDKLRVLDEKLRIKERELKNSIVQNSSAVLQSEIENMQIQLERKNRELTRFRLELDSILLVLKELHSQGVKIPLPKYLQSLF